MPLIRCLQRCVRSLSRPRREGDVSRVEDSAPAPSGGASQEISGDCRAFCLIKNDWVKVELSPPRPSSQAFQDRPESGAMSVYLEDEINSTGHFLGELQKRWEGYWIFSLTVSQLREEFSQEVVRDPQSDFPGHALVRDPNGKRSPGKRSRMASACMLVSEPGTSSSDAEEAQPLGKSSFSVRLAAAILQFGHRARRYFRQRARGTR